MHGTAININPDMRYFHNIVPCGITDKKYDVVSVSELTELKEGSGVTVDGFADIYVRQFEEEFNARFDDRASLSGKAASAYLDGLSETYRDR